MACTDNISAQITSDCTTSITGGLEVKAWIFNRSVVSAGLQDVLKLVLTDNVLSVLALGASTGKTITGVRKLLNSGSDVVVADNRPKKWAHSFMFEMFSRTAANIANGDRLNDVVVIVENKDKATGGDGTFEVLGLRNGLWKTTDTQSSNTANGSRIIELKSLPGQEEEYSKVIAFDTDYATTLGLLDAMCP